MSKKKERQKIRVMADYGSSGIWGFSDNQSKAFRHGMLEHSDLKLPDTLCKQFEKWIHEYEKYNLEDKLNRKKFNENGLKLAKSLKDHLGEDVYVEFQGESKDGGVLESVLIQ
jgi:hypothetical protein